MFVTMGAAVHAYDSIIRSDDSLRPQISHYLVSPDARAAVEAAYGQDLERWKSIAAEQGLRPYQIYIARASGEAGLGAFAVRAGCPFHRCLSDNVRDMGPDLSGERSAVLLGHRGAMCEPPIDIPAVLKAVLPAMGIGCRKATMTNRQLRALAVVLGIELPHRLPKNIEVRAYSCPYPRKGVSPCLHAGVFSLAICSPSARASTAKAWRELNAAPLVVALRRGQLAGCFLTGAVVPASQCQTSGLAGITIR